MLHYNFPVSVESYVQQIGRSGRSGQNSACVTFLNPRDFFFSRNMTLLDHFYASLTLEKIIDFLCLLPRAFTQKYNLGKKNSKNKSKKFEPVLGSYRSFGKYFVILEEAAKKRFLLKKEQMLILLSEIERAGPAAGFAIQLIFTLPVNIKIAFRAKADGLEEIKKDEFFKRIASIARKNKNGFAFNLSALANHLGKNPLQVVAEMEKLSRKFSAFCIKSGYGIYVKVTPENQSYKKSGKDRLRAHCEFGDKILTGLKKAVRLALRRHLRRIDLFYFIIQKAIRESKDVGKRSDMVQESIKDYFALDEIEYVEKKIGFGVMKRSLPIEFVGVKGWVLYFFFGLFFIYFILSYPNENFKIEKINYKK